MCSILSLKLIHLFSGNKMLYVFYLNQFQIKYFKLNNNKLMSILSSYIKNKSAGDNDYG